MYPSRSSIVIHVAVIILCSKYLWSRWYLIDKCILWQHPTCLHIPPLYLKITIKWDPLEDFYSNTGGSWWEGWNTTPLPQVQQSHWQHKNRYPSQHIFFRKDRLTLPNHESNGSSNLLLQLFGTICSGIPFTLTILSLQINRGNPTADCMDLFFQKYVVCAWHTWIQGKTYCTNPSCYCWAHIDQWWVELILTYLCSMPSPPALY